MSYNPESSAPFHAKDDELAEKIRKYRENMRRKPKKSSENEDFQFRRENMFDFEAWYRAHFHDDFETKLRKERIEKFAEQYQEQMRRISRGQYRVRPPRPYVDPQKQSDIEKQMFEMAEREYKEKILTTFNLGVMLFIAATIIACIIEYNKFQNVRPYEDPYAMQNTEPLSDTEDK